jgi:hypothetical protein
MSSTNAPGDTHGTGEGGIGKPSEEALRLGYEPDGYDSTSVFSVPLLVILFFVLAFGATTILFGYLSKPPENPGVHPMAAERNKSPLDERLARINRGGEVDQPRLEPLRVRTGDARAITRPETKEGNPPYLHPEDNRADRQRTPELFRVGWTGKDKQFARVPLDDIIDGRVKALFPVQKNGTKPIASSNLPTAANAGRGAEHSLAIPPKAPASPEATGKGIAPKPPEKQPEPMKQPEAPKPPEKQPEEKK